MIKDQKYGIPELKKFPMPDASHVRSAIRFFNYVPPRYEKRLAAAILRRMKEYGISFDDFNVGDENRFSKYVPKTYLAHYGVPGQEWYVRRFQPYPSGYSGKGKFVGKEGLTPRGREKLKEYVNSEAGQKAIRQDDVQRTVHSRLNIEQINENTDLLRRGRIIKRVSGIETLSDKRKYVSLGDSFDSKQYVDDFYNGHIPVNGVPYEYTYKLKKNIKVAPADTVKQYILDKFGSYKIKDLGIEDAKHYYPYDRDGQAGQKLYSTLDKIKDVPIKSLLKDMNDYRTVNTLSLFKENNIDDEIKNMGKAASYVHHRLMNGTMMKDSAVSKYILNEFKKKGYDAIVDPEDVGSYEYPMIVINPADVLKYKSKREL